MQLLDLTLPTPAENLALDEALLDEAESQAASGETLRFWESPRPMVVLGRSSRLDVEVHRAVCRDLDIPVLRRSSGGAAIVAGPGCLMFALVLNLPPRGPSCGRSGPPIAAVLDQLAKAFDALGVQTQCRGTSDLVIGQQKVSGNSVRMKHDHLLYHGTLLYGFPLELIGRVLAMPPRQPDYRRQRPHAAFVANLPLSGEAIRRAVAAIWDARASRSDWPQARVAQLVAEKYGRREWNEGEG